MSQYLKDSDLFFEILLSKGRGKLTRKAEDMFILIGKNTIRKKESHYVCIEDKEDCLQSGLLSLFTNWRSFNEKKFSLALPYFTEVFKRGMAEGYNKLYPKNANGDRQKVDLVSLNSTYI